MDKVGLGRRGEIFVMQKMIEREWNFPKNYYDNLEGLDWVFEKDGRVIRVQVKTCLNNYITFSVKGKPNFDYLIITNLKKCWIIPKLVYGLTNHLTKTFKRLEEKWSFYYKFHRKWRYKCNFVQTLKTSCKLPL